MSLTHWGSEFSVSMNHANAYGKVAALTLSVIE